MVTILKTITNKPVGVHLTSGIGGHKGNTAYYTNADYVFLQTGWNRTPAEITAMVKQAMVVTGKPVVASEYAKESRTPAARALGNAACLAGAIGTGNGRTIQFCGYEEVSKKKDYTGEAVAVLGIAAIAVGAYYLHTNYDFELKLNATEDYQSYGTRKSFAVLDNNKLNFNVDYEYSNFGFCDAENNRVLFTFTGIFE